MVKDGCQPLIPLPFECDRTVKNATIGFLERWSVGETIYFTFVTTLTIGYGDLAPKRLRRLRLIRSAVCRVIAGLQWSIGRYLGRICRDG
jgi:hypothetical protein